MINYVQCQLQNKSRNQVSWIPEEFAKIGKILELKDYGKKKKWSKGWEVISVGIKRSHAYVLDREMNYKKTRKASDI